MATPSRECCRPGRYPGSSASSLVHPSRGAGQQAYAAAVFWRSDARELHREIILRPPPPTCLDRRATTPCGTPGVLPPPAETLPQQSRRSCQLVAQLASRSFRSVFCTHRPSPAPKSADAPEPRPALPPWREDSRPKPDRRLGTSPNALVDPQTCHRDRADRCRRPGAALPYAPKGPPADGLVRRLVSGERRSVDRAAGIEPAWPAWKAGAWPFGHARRGSPVMAPFIRGKKS